MALRVVTTVITAASQPRKLADLADIKDDLSLETKDSDSKLLRLIISASAAAEQYMNRVLHAETVKDEVWADCLSSDGLKLSRFPVVSVLSVVENGVSLEENVDFKVSANSGILIRIGSGGNPVSWPSGAMVVTYQAGYSTIPYDVRDAVGRMVKNAFLSLGRDRYLKSEDIPGVRSAQYWVAGPGENGAMSPDVTDILENYRQPVIS